MRVLGNQMFFDNNPFEAVRGRTDLNGLQKVREVLTLNNSDTERNQMNLQALSILICKKLFCNIRHFSVYKR